MFCERTRKFLNTKTQRHEEKGIKKPVQGECTGFNGIIKLWVNYLIGMSAIAIAIASKYPG